MARVGNTSIPSGARSEFGKTATVIAVGCLIGVLFAGSTIATPLYVIYKHQFGFSQITLTLIYAVYIVGNLTALLVFGRMSDEVGRRRTAVIAIGIAVAGAVVFLLAHGVASLYVARVLSGLAIGIGAGTGTAWLAELIAEQDRSRATVIATIANFTGLGLGALVAGLLAEYVALPLRTPFNAISWCWWLSRPSSPSRARPWIGRWLRSRSCRSGRVPAFRRRSGRASWRPR
ncbi:MFS transporter [Bradyrhizobium arachidis]|uniref:MFS transporter n=1 Tax=Bradyrhizobium arachidis TaxID=858423 RepID=UPI0008F3E2BD|nr:MFS transporter [Bradyrhizobium arachidis]SFU61758.1 Major Facilitator Superfamily protein [Bradyrhizobium arachidis]